MPSPDALALARETARSGAGIRVLTRGLRVGHQRFLELWDEKLLAQDLSGDRAVGGAHALRAT